MSFAIVLFSPITVADSRDKANTFRRPSILFRPPEFQTFPQTKDKAGSALVEPPGTAPGSDPFITSAFMSIVPKNKSNIGAWGGGFQGDSEICQDKPKRQKGLDRKKDKCLLKRRLVEHK